jgi:hypothetical protein
MRLIGRRTSDENAVEVLREIVCLPETFAATVRAAVEVSITLAAAVIGSYDQLRRRRQLMDGPPCEIVDFRGVAKRPADIKRVPDYA